MPEQTTKQNIHQTLNAVQAKLAKEGVAKDRRNEQQKYAFRGIDEIFNALAPIMASEKLSILPSYSDRQVEARLTASGGTIYNVSLVGQFRFIAEDGSELIAQTFGEAMDSGDKATSKAMSAALKYAVLQTFCIPTEGDNDTDAVTPPATSPKPKAVTTPVKPVTPNAGPAKPVAPASDDLVAEVGQTRDAITQILLKADSKVDGKEVLKPFYKGVFGSPFPIAVGSYKEPLAWLLQWLLSNDENVKAFLKDAVAVGSTYKQVAISDLKK